MTNIKYKEVENIVKYWELKKDLPNIENQKVVQEFLINLKDKNRTESSICTYRYVLQSFFERIVQSYTLLTSAEIQVWLTELSRKQKKHSLQNKLGILKIFFKYCVKKGYIEKNPLDERREWEWILEPPLLTVKTFKNNENLRAVNEFLLSKSTEVPRAVLHRFRKYLQCFFENREKHFLLLSSMEFEEWFNDNKYSKRSDYLNNYLNALRAFYMYYVEKECLKESPILVSGRNFWELNIRLPNAKNHEVIEEYLYSLKKAGRSKKGIIKIRISLQTFFKEKKKSLLLFTSEDVNHWIKENINHVTKHSIENYLYFLRGFYNYCVEKGYMEENPIKYQWGMEDEYWKVRIPLPNEHNKSRVNEFLSSLYVSNYSKYTIKGYRDILQGFFQGIKEMYSEVAPDEILHWLTYLRTRCCEATIAFRLSALSSFYNFCVEEGYMEKSPIKRRWFPRLPKPVPKYLNKEEVAKIRKQLEKEHIRNRALVEFLLSSGCRVGEVSQSNIEDVDLENRTAIVKGKGNKVRQVHFSERCALLLEKYLESRSDSHPALFVSIHWNPRRLTAKGILHLFNKLGEKARLSKSLHPHRMRHTFATDLLENGADLSFIADELGHSNLRTTQIYASLPNRKIKSLYRKYMG